MTPTKRSAGTAAKATAAPTLPSATTASLPSATTASLPSATTASLFLIDGTSFCYRAYYAIRSLSSSKGEPTNAIYGFITMIRKLIETHQPDYLAVGFDRKEPTFRHARYKEYKAHRKPMPEDLVQQLEPIKEFCRLWGLALYEQAGFEADDLLGTLARLGEKRKMEVRIVTGDKDFMQLVSERIKIINPHKEDLICDQNAVRKRFDGLGPEKVVDVLALMGDSSDNIPGVPGVGEKTAIKLIQEFGSVENLLEHVGRIKSKSQQTLLKENAQVARLSKDLATIDTQMSLQVDWEKMKTRGKTRGHKRTSFVSPGFSASPDLVEFFKRYEFRTLLKEFMPTGESQAAAQGERNYQIIHNEKEFEAFLKELSAAEAFSFDTETTSEDPMRAELVGLSFAIKPFHAAYIPVSTISSSLPAGQAGGNDESLSVEKVLAKLRPILENPKQKKYGQNVKYDWMVLKRTGVTARGIAFDTMIASYLVNPLKLNHNLDDISLEYLGVKKITTVSLIGSGKNKITMAQVPLDKIGEYACEDADCVFRLVPLLEAKLKEHKLTDLFSTLEMPLSEVLATMEMNGVALDLKLLKKLSDAAGEELEALTTQIYRAAGEEFNINSTKQLGEIMFVKLGLPIVKRTKTGYSTDVSVLEKLAVTHELPRRLLEYREKQKLKSTYLDALPEMINPHTGLIHTSYNQTTTATGRLSSSDPNLQNIPIRSEAGRAIRKAFVPRSPKNSILSADYSQIELRVLAHLCEDTNLVTAFREDRDIHKFTATLLYGVKEADVTREMRDLAKLVNFSIIYGKTAYGLSHDLGISVSEADGFIQNYFDRYRRVREYLDAQKDLARKQGFLTTILGRRSYFPEINSKNVQVRQFAERAAINAPIQGAAADLIKLAMIGIQGRLEVENFASLMIMQVHDELVFDFPETEKARLENLVREEMAGAARLRVPLKVDFHFSSSWYK